MLVLSRHPNETIQIGDNITVKVVRIQGNVVKLAFEAPKDVKIMRQEVLDRDRQRAASVQIQSTPLSVLNVDDSAELSLDDVLPADDGPMCLMRHCRRSARKICRLNASAEALKLDVQEFAMSLFDHRSWLCGIIIASLYLTGLSQDTTPEQMRVMSFNVRYGTAADGENHWDKRKSFVVDTIVAFQPDLLGTQENLDFQRDFLAAELPEYAVHSAGRNDGKDDGETVAIYYRRDRFEPVDQGHFWLSEQPDRIGSVGWDAALPRITSWLKLRDRADPKKREFIFANTHFDHKGRVAREQSAILLKSRLSQIADNSPVVLAGDFNSGEGSPAYQSLFDSGKDAPTLVDSYRSVQPEIELLGEGTFSGFRVANRKGGRIDWIAVSPSFQIISADIDRTERGGRTPSDHFPVRAVIQWP